MFKVMGMATVTEVSHLYSLRDFWRHFGLCRAAERCDCCLFVPCTNILTYLLTEKLRAWEVKAVKRQSTQADNNYFVPL